MWLKVGADWLRGGFNDARLQLDERLSSPSATRRGRSKVRLRQAVLTPEPPPVFLVPCQQPVPSWAAPPAQTNTGCPAWSIRSSVTNTAKRHQSYFVSVLAEETALHCFSTVTPRSP